MKTKIAEVKEVTYERIQVVGTEMLQKLQEENAQLHLGTG
jgi:hypothetical protein